MGLMGPLGAGGLQPLPRGYSLQKAKTMHGTRCKCCKSPSGGLRLWGFQKAPKPYVHAPPPPIILLHPAHKIGTESKTKNTGFGQLQHP